MAAIRPCTGTTADWKAVEDTLILKEREVGVEIDTSGHYLVRQGDGKNKFFDLPIIVNNARYRVRCRAVFLLPAVALVGGNCNNGDYCGADYLNLNNSAGNANWNIGASNFFSYRSV